MYQAFYKMKLGPFPTQPMPEVFFKSRTHAEALSFVQHGIKEHESFLLVTGEYGLGKTLLCLRLMKYFHKMQDLYYSLYVPTTNYTYEMILRNMNKVIGIESVGENTKTAELQSNLFDFYKKRGAEAKRFFIVIDDFQEIDSSTLHYLKLLANFNTDEGFFPFSLILFAHPLILDRLKPPFFGSLQQKISRHFRLSRFSLGETKEYIYFRLLYSGARGKPFFTDEAIKYIFQLSSGNPRFINNICDASLLIGSRKGREKIDKKIVAEAAEFLSRDKKPEVIPTPIKRPSVSAPVTNKKYTRPEPEVFLSKAAPLEEDLEFGDIATRKANKGFEDHVYSEAGIDFTDIPSDSQRMDKRREIFGAPSPSNQWFWGDIWGRKGIRLFIWIIILLLMFLFVYRYRGILFGKIPKQTIRYKIDRNFLDNHSSSSLNKLGPKDYTKKRKTFTHNAKTKVITDMTANETPKSLKRDTNKKHEIKTPIAKSHKSEVRPHKIQANTYKTSTIYSLILSSHLNRENALKDIHRLTGGGLSPIFLKKISSKGKLWWVIFQGAYKSRKDAEEAKIIYHFPDALVRRVRSVNLTGSFSANEKNKQRLMQIKPPKFSSYIVKRDKIGGNENLLNAFKTLQAAGIENGAIK